MNNRNPLFGSATVDRIDTTYGPFAPIWQLVDPYNTMRAEKLLEISGIQEGDPGFVVDLGCGDGTLGLLAATRVTGVVCFVECCSAMMDKTIQNCNAAWATRQFQGRPITARGFYALRADVFDIQAVRDILKTSLVVKNAGGDHSRIDNAGWEYVFCSRIEHHCLRPKQHLETVAKVLLSTDGRIVLDYFSNSIADAPTRATVHSINPACYPNQVIASYGMSPTDSSLEAAARGELVGMLGNDGILEIDGQRASRVWAACRDATHADALAMHRGRQFQFLRAHPAMLHVGHQEAHRILRGQAAPPLTTFAQYRSWISARSTEEQKQFALQKFSAAIQNEHPQLFQQIAVVGSQRFKLDFEWSSYMCSLRVRPARRSQQRDNLLEIAQQLQSSIIWQTSASPAA